MTADFCEALVRLPPTITAGSEAFKEARHEPLVNRSTHARPGPRPRHPRTSYDRRSNLSANCTVHVLFEE